MDTDDAADLVGSMPNEQQQEVLSHMEDLEQAGDIVDLLHYDEDSAGGLMGKEASESQRELDRPHLPTRT